MTTFEQDTCHRKFDTLGAKLLQGVGRNQLDGGEIGLIPLRVSGEHRQPTDSGMSPYEKIGQYAVFYTPLRSFMRSLVRH